MKNMCESCGNHYDNAFVVLMKGKEHVFDCFECASNKLAPICRHCDTKVIGHGVEMDGRIYCCNHCAMNDELQKDPLTRKVEQELGSEQH